MVGYLLELAADHRCWHPIFCRCNLLLL